MINMSWGQIERVKSAFLRKFSIKFIFYQLMEGKCAENQKLC